MPRAARDLAELPLEQRERELLLTPCRPLLTPKVAIDFAIARFHETWTRYRSITPTVYAVGDRAPGVYVTLGRLRARYRLDGALVDAIAEVFEARYAARGFLVASEAVAADGARALFGLRGRVEDEVHEGALDLALLAPHEGAFLTELDMGSEAWRWRWWEARHESGLP